jgi:hypothetical protein
LYCPGNIRISERGLDMRGSYSKRDQKCSNGFFWLVCLGGRTPFEDVGFKLEDR